MQLYFNKKITVNYHFHSYTCLRHAYYTQ